MRFIFKKKEVLAAIIGLSLILSLNFFQEDVKGFFYFISSPIQKTFWRVGDGLSDFLKGMVGAQNLKKENEELKLKIQENFSLQDSLKEMEKENRTLREALGLELQKELRLEFAEIIGKDIGQDSILIDKGSKDGISKDLLVITSQKVLIGTISDVYQNYSRVLLISDEKKSFEAKISGTNITGLLKGLGGSRFFLDLIPKDGEIKEGDLVVSGKFLIGSIKEVKEKDVSPFRQAEISPFFDISSLDRVFIIINP